MTNETSYRYDAEEELQPLPPGWKIVPERGVGVSCLDSHGDVVSQHPFDANHFRALCWELYYQRIALRIAKIRRANAVRATEKDRAILVEVIKILTGEIRL